MSTITPNKTKNLNAILGGVPDWKNFRYKENAQPGKYGPNYAKFKEAFTKNSVQYTEGNGKEPPHNGGSFSATIIIDAERKLLFGHNNKQSVTPFQTSYTETQGTETTETSEFGISFTFGTEFGGACASISAELGFDISESMSETFSKTVTKTHEVTVAAGQELYVYQLALKCAYIK